MGGGRSGTGKAICTCVLACLGLAACRGAGAEDGRDPPANTVTARKMPASAGAASEEESSGVSAASRARAMALARFASGDEPVYPEMSRRLQEEGTVELKIGLLHDGSVQELAIGRSSGHRRLDDAALAAARTWRFNPRTGGGEVEEIRYRVVFQLVDG